MNNNIVDQLIAQRRWAALLSILLVVVLAIGAKNLRFESDYKIFFGDDNPQLIAHESNQATFAKSDNITFVIAPKDGKVFTPETLTSIIELTDKAWTMPYSTRVDSITNYQHTWVDEDDLIVEDLVQDPHSRDAQTLAALQKIAVNEPQLVHYMISPTAHATAISVDLSLPDIRAEADIATQEVVAWSRVVRDEMEVANPNLKIYLIGQTVVNNTFNEMSRQDMEQLIPLMFVLIVVVLQFIVRTWAGTFGTVVVIALSVVATQGMMGWVGYAINQVNVASPIIILTLAVCDCVHILNNYLYNLSKGESRLVAMKESLYINLQPVFLTSLTTAIGFLSMNFSDSPPFRELGNIAAFGVMMAFLLSMTVFPILVLALPMRARATDKPDAPMLLPLARFVNSHYNKLFVSLLLVAVVLIAFMFKNELNDDTVQYFHTDVPFRQAADYTQENLTGFDEIAYALDSGQSNGISSPAFLAKVEAFANWYLSQPEVVHVSSYTNIIKRLNQNMHEGDADWYRIPDSSELAAQYLLLYEMSLPFGLDLNNQINIDKSKLLLKVRVKDQKAQQLIDLDLRAQGWLQANAPELVVPGASVSVMFAHIGQRNIDSMLTGSLAALVLVTLTLIIALRSLRFGLISLLPNAFPAGIAFGLWGIFVGEVNLAVAVIFAITLGIVVDDTVHFITKYLRGRQLHGYPPLQAVEYAFTVVGKAIVTTTVVLAAGFFVLAFSSFDVNASMGLMVGITIIIALIWDFLFLPALLIKLDK